MSAQRERGREREGVEREDGRELTPINPFTPNSAKFKTDKFSRVGIETGISHSRFRIDPATVSY